MGYGKEMAFIRFPSFFALWTRRPRVAVAEKTKYHWVNFL